MLAMGDQSTRLGSPQGLERTNRGKRTCSRFVARAISPHVTSAPSDLHSLSRGNGEMECSGHWQAGQSCTAKVRSSAGHAPAARTAGGRRTQQGWPGVGAPGTSGGGGAAAVEAVQCRVPGVAAGLSPAEGQVPHSSEGR